MKMVSWYGEGEGEGEWQQQNFHWLIIANLFDFQKRCLVTWVVVIYNTVVKKNRQY